MASSFIPIKNTRSSPSQLGSNDLGPLLGGEGLRTLDRCTNSTVNDQLREDTNGTGDTKENCVVAGLGETVVLEKYTRVLLNC